MTKTKLTLPTLHLNGTAALSLLRDYETAHNAVQAAITAVAMAYPNGRDYYPQGPEALSAALLEHDRRLTLLKAVSDELESLILGIADLEAERTSRRRS